MAVDTPTHFKNLVIYEVFVRNYGPNGTFADVTTDLPRIKALGVDVVWLMPIHPTGQVKRKGGHGSPYAIADYRAVNPKFGTEADLKTLINAAHKLGLKVMIDVVYNHTSPDSVLATQHPEWFYCEKAGEPAPRFAEWSDVVDLSYHDPALSQYQIDSLLKWVKLGVDGFRCDVASLVPVEFWQQARQAVAKIKPNFIWLANRCSCTLCVLCAARGIWPILMAKFTRCLTFVTITTSTTSGSPVLGAICRWRITLKCWTFRRASTPQIILSYALLKITTSPEPPRCLQIRTT